MLTLAASLVDDRHRAVAVHHDNRPIALSDEVRIVELHDAARARLDGALLDLAARSRTTDMERTHRELRARLTNRLGTDDADRLADVHLVATTEISAVTHGAHAATLLAGQHGANQYPLDASRFDTGNANLVDLLVGLDERLVSDGVGDVLERDAPQNTLAERRDDLATLLELANPDSIEGLAVVVGDDGILCHVDETPCQVTGVRRLQGGVGQAFARTVC